MPILTNFLKGIADSIRERKGTTEPINAQDFATEISNLGAKYDVIKITGNGIVDVEDYKTAEVEVLSEADVVLSNLISNNLEEIEIPYNVLKIPDYAFYYKNKLKKVTFHDNITSMGKECFRNVNLTEIILPKNLTTIGEYCFSDSYISKLFIPKALTKVGNYSFQNLRANAEIIFEEGIETIAEGMFANCSNMSSIVIPSTVKKISRSAFNNTSLKNINLDNIEEIGGYGLSNTKIEKINLPSSLHTIGDRCFQRCSNLSEFTFSNVITLIPSECFSYCSALKYIHIPNNITKIDTYAFNSCPITVFMENTNPPEVAVNSFSSNLVRIYVPKGSRATYIATSNWSTYADKIVEPNTITVNIPSSLLNNEAYTYSVDEGEWTQFTSSQIVFNNISIIKFKNTNSGTTIKIGTTSGGSDIGTIANAELMHGTVSDETIYLTIA